MFHYDPAVGVESSLAYYWAKEMDVDRFEEALPEPEDLFVASIRDYSICDAQLSAAIQTALRQHLNRAFPNGDSLTSALVSFVREVELARDRGVRAKGGNPESSDREEEEERVLTKEQRQVLLFCRLWCARPTAIPFEHRSNRSLGFQYSTFGYVVRAIRTAVLLGDDDRVESGFVALRTLCDRMRRAGLSFPQGIDRQVRQFWGRGYHKQYLNQVLSVIHEHNERPSDAVRRQMMAQGNWQRCSYQAS